ncbi:MAG: histidine kinase [Chitinophagaceae bacterium]|nr:histidine kinase [Chitinophagaceae bacterium]
MAVNPLVFSNNRRYRIARHSLFWLLWIIYYTVFQITYWQGRHPFGQTVGASLVEVTLSTPLDMVFCYSIIYYLLPRFLYKGHYIQMALLWMLFSFLFILVFRWYNHQVVPYIREMFDMPPPVFSKNVPWLFLNLFYQINMEGGLAAAIKLGKMWAIKQQELELLKKEKQHIEPTLQAGALQPVFLINALDKVEQLALTRPPLIPDMMKKIKSLLLYVIYDNNQASVSLEKELYLLEEYIGLERTGNQDSLKVVAKIMGNLSGERIAPFIILPLVENGFRQLASMNMPEKCMDLEVRVDDGHFNMKVGWSKPIDSSTLMNGNTLSLQHIGRRLNLLYPESHELKVTITTEQFIVNLKINLNRAIT